MGKVVALSITDAIEMWVDIKPFIDKALKYNADEMDSSDIFHGILRGKYLTIITYDEEPIGSATTIVVRSVVVLQTIDMPNKRVCNILALASDHAEDDRGIIGDEVYRLAREAGADSIYVYGRRGWTRYLQNDGFKEIYTVLERKL